MLLVGAASGRLADAVLSILIEWPHCYSSHVERSRRCARGVLRRPCLHRLRWRLGQCGRQKYRRHEEVRGGSLAIELWPGHLRRRCQFENRVGGH